MHAYRHILEPNVQNYGYERGTAYKDEGCVIMYHVALEFR